MESEDFLRRVELFKNLRKESLEVLGSQVRLVCLPEGHIFRDTVRDKGPVDGLYIVKSGLAKVTRASQVWEAEAVLAILKPGDSFGEIGLIDGGPPSADVTAMEPMECYFLPRDAFLAALEENPEIALGMVHSFCTMVRAADQWITQLL